MGANTGPLSLRVAEGLSRDFAGLLAATGLQLAHDKIASVGRALNHKHGAAETAGGVGIQGHSIGFEVCNFDQLINFFRTLNNREVNDAGAQKALKFLAHALNDDFVVAYCQALENKEEQRYKKLEALLCDVTSEFVRLGMQANAAILRTHLERSIDGDLSAFLLADSHGLLVFHNFSADRWHQDSTAEGYDTRWSKALDAAKAVRALPNSERVFKRVHSNLMDAARQARKEINEKLAACGSDDGGYWGLHGPGMIQTLNRVDGDLAMMGSESEG